MQIVLVIWSPRPSARPSPVPEYLLGAWFALPAVSRICSNACWTLAELFIDFTGRVSRRCKVLKGFNMIAAGPTALDVLVHLRSYPYLSSYSSLSP